MARERLGTFMLIGASGITGTPARARSVNDNEVNRIGTEAVLSMDSNFTA